MKNLTKISVATSVVSVANVAKVGVASALIGAGLFLSACGGDSGDRLEKLATKALKEKSPNAQLLSFDEAQKEFGAKDKECFINRKNVVGREVIEFYAFGKVDDKIKGYEFTIIDDKDIVDISGVWDSTEIDAFKNKLKGCF